ncbi:MAG: GTP cyclohydrolase I [Acidobacteriota bacterium]
MPRDAELHRTELAGVRLSAPQRTRFEAHLADPKLVTRFPVDEPEAGEPAQQVVEARVGYVPGAQILGLSKLTRLVRLHVRRFTMQERIGRDLARALEDITGAPGPAVRLERVHLCTQMRGVRETQAVTRTIYWSGVYRESPALRRELLEPCGR